MHCNMNIREYCVTPCSIIHFKYFLELGLHNGTTAPSPITTNPVALSGLSSHWTSLYPAFGQGLLGQNIGQLAGQNPLGLGLLGHVQQAQLQQQQQQLLQQFFATQQKVNNLINYFLLDDFILFIYDLRNKYIFLKS